MNELRRQPKWHYTLEQLIEKSPSGREGTSFEMEQIQQSRGVRFIAQAGSGLKLPSSTIYVASVFLHRFYTRNTLAIPVYEVAAACIFLACKTEENPRKTKDVALAVTRVALKSSSIEADSREVNRWIDPICFTEGLVLEALYFDFEVANPYEALTAHIENAGIADDDREAISAKAISFINDSCRTVLSVIETSKAIAGAALAWALAESGSPVDPEAEWIKKSGLQYSQLNEIVTNMCTMINIVRAGKLDGQVYTCLPEIEAKVSAEVTESTD